MANRPKPTKLQTPFGRAAWCALARPSDKFNPDGQYSARVLLDPGPETEALIAKLDALYEDAYQANLEEARKDKPKITSIKRADKPYKGQEDPDTGEQLPGYQIQARMNAVQRGKSPGKDTEGNPIPGPKLYTQRPQVVDAKLRSLIPATGQMGEVGPGSIIRLDIDVTTFFTAALGSGISLRLIGVQVKDLKHPGSRDAGFGETDGFEVSETKASDPIETTPAPVTEEPATVADDVPTEW